VKICMLHSVNVIYLRINQKFIIIFISNMRRVRMYSEGCGNISKLKNNFPTTATISTTHHEYYFCNLVISVLSEECVRNNKTLGSTEW